MWSLLSSTALLLLAETSFATPIKARVPPTLSKAKAFSLVANATKLDLLFSPSINGYNVAGVHVGAGQQTLVLDYNATRLFYVNGTNEEVDSSQASVLADTGPTVYSLRIALLASSLPDSDYVSYAGLGIGVGPKGVAGIASEATIPQLYGPGTGTFVVCNITNPTYGNPQLPVRFAAEKDAATGSGEKALPAGCVPIALLPQCAELQPVPEGAYFNHDFVQEVPCYPSVRGIDWRAAA